MSAKLYFRYGAMGSSKTANLLMVAHNYESQGKKVLLIKPSLDTRSETQKIESRTGLCAECIDIDNTSNIRNIFLTLVNTNNFEYHAILVDEAQFLTKYQVKQLAKMVDTYNIPVIAYGLKNSYIDGELFEGSQALLYYSNKIEEIKTVCSCPECNSKATMNLRILNGEAVYNGEMINCGDTKPTSDYYMPVCRKHYYNQIGYYNLK